MDETCSVVLLLIDREVNIDVAAAVAVLMVEKVDGGDTADVLLVEMRRFCVPAVVDTALAIVIDIHDDPWRQ